MTDDLMLRELLELLTRLVHRAGLDAHYSDHPDLRPSLRDVSLALAKMDGSPLAQRLDLIDVAVEDLSASNRSVDADDVLTYASALLAHPAA